HGEESPRRVRGAEQGGAAARGGEAQAVEALVFTVHGRPAAGVIGLTRRIRALAAPSASGRTTSGCAPGSGPGAQAPRCGTARGSRPGIAPSPPASSGP